MKSICLAIIAVGLGISSAQAQSSNWVSNFQVTDAYTQYSGCGKCYQPCSCPFEPCFKFSIGAIFLERISGPSNTVLVDLGSNEVATANDFDPGLDFGGSWQIAFEKCLCDDKSIEFRYFNVSGLDSEETITNPNGLAFAVSGGTLGSLAFTPVTGQFSYNADLHSFELNLRQDVGSKDIQLIAGVRHFIHNEWFGGTITQNATPTNNAFASFDADNYLTGGQIGADIRLLQCGKFRFETVGKLGCMYNSASAGYNGVHSGTLPALNQSLSVSDDRFSLLGELEVAGVYHFTDCISLRTAYHLLGMTNIATAPGQVAATNIAGPTMDVTSSDILYHGFSVMCEIGIP
ncbi:BBP7 family outer membrane beta-barrel protein [Calycomorphotria hydatis]|uniref:Uncharacterized protein n=1 Tax=Calycomorphotria hydatis TaxID=2528027 RepID=A0A517T4V7_9PLAN|nr:BBP7 family outer membrane beta-barrel protein [Calycomorphotria hydatis]QDT63381.1 hypothetical protein V22_06020 [Calycomorphotria hydatis]